QSQKWFLLQFSGIDGDIDISRHHREFARWRWSTPEAVLRDIVPFKRAVYDQVIAAFRPQLENIQ
ncbi:MAG: RNA pyrophosphohydrolase, partial [Boseongicola sp.]